jgi:para-aminobenzoate synthetase component I
MNPTVLGLVRRPGGLWMDTSSPVGSAGANSWVSAEPAVWLSGRGHELQLLPGPTGDRGWLARVQSVDPGSGTAFDRLAAIARGLALPEPDEPRADFRGGLAGCFSYDLGRRFERVPRRLPEELPWDFLLGLFDEVLQVGADGHARWHRLPGTAPRLSLPSPRTRPALREVGASHPPTPEMDRAQHAARVARIRRLIRDGTIYQANLTLRFTAPAPDPDAALATFLRLRRDNPSPFGLYAELPGATIVSASPESFLGLDTAGRASSRPIKGTSARGSTPAEDEARRAALLASAKDRSELSMIVDLVRNDLGRVCAPGSVDRQPELVAEGHPTVWHLVGDVTGRLAPERDAFDLLRASFPPGSCIGAPKIRTMAALEELELSRRGAYTGALGWIGLDGAMALSVAIRTLIFRDRQVVYGVGGGIVWDSDADAEWSEALLKGRALAEALRPDGHAPDPSPPCRPEERGQAATRP